MAVKKRIKLRNVQNVGDSKTALIDVPIGKRVHQIQFTLSYTSGTNTIAGAVAHVSEVRVKINGKIQRTVSGQQLRDMNILNGTAYDMTGLPNTGDGVTFPIFFAEPWRKDARDQDALALATRWGNNGEFALASLQVEIDLSAAIASSASIAMVAWAVVDDFIPVDPPTLTKWIRQSFPAGGTSFDITTIDRKDFLTQLSVYPDSGGSNAPSELDLRINGDIKHEFGNVENVGLLTNSGMTPAASGRTSNIYDLVLDHDDLLGSAYPLNGTSDMTLTIKAASAMSGTTIVIIQRIGPPE